MRLGGGDAQTGAKALRRWAGLSRKPREKQGVHKLRSREPCDANESPQQKEWGGKEIVLGHRKIEVKLQCPRGSVGRGLQSSVCI